MPSNVNAAIRDEIREVKAKMMEVEDQRKALDRRLKVLERAQLELADRPRSRPRRQRAGASFAKPTAEAVIGALAAGPLSLWDATEALGGDPARGDQRDSVRYQFTRAEESGDVVRIGNAKARGKGRPHPVYGLASELARVEDAVLDYLRSNPDTNYIPTEMSIADLDGVAVDFANSYLPAAVDGLIETDQVRVNENGGERYISHKASTVRPGEGVTS